MMDDDRHAIRKVAYDEQAEAQIVDQDQEIARLREALQYAGTCEHGVSYSDHSCIACWGDASEELARCAVCGSTTWHRGGYCLRHDGDAAPSLREQLARVTRERDQARRNVAYLVGQYHLLRGVNRAQRTRIRHWIAQAATRRRDALQQAADLVRGWHVSKGGYTELAYQIEQLAQDAPSTSPEQVRHQAIEDAALAAWKTFRQLTVDGAGTEWADEFAADPHDAQEVINSAIYALLDAPPAGADAGAQSARVGAIKVVLADALGAWTRDEIPLMEVVGRVADALRIAVPDAPRGHERADAGEDDVAYLTARGWTHDARWYDPAGLFKPLLIDQAVSIQRMRDAAPVTATTTECASCNTIQPCRDDGENYVCNDADACRARVAGEVH